MVDAGVHLAAYQKRNRGDRKQQPGPSAHPADLPFLLVRALISGVEVDPGFRKIWRSGGDSQVEGNKYVVSGDSHPAVKAQEAGRVGVSVEATVPNRGERVLASLVIIPAGFHFPGDS
jgi:hypothetical protein